MRGLTMMRGPQAQQTAGMQVGTLPTSVTTAQNGIDINAIMNMMIMLMMIVMMMKMMTKGLEGVS